MKISYVTTYNSLDIHNWSGLGHYIAKSLEFQKASIDYIGDLNALPHLALILKKMLYTKLGKNFSFEREPYMAMQFSKQVNAILKPDTDIVFSPGTIPIAYLNSSKPKVFYTDATFAGMINFYPQFSNFPSETIKHGNEIEQAALESSSIAIFSSEWAAKSALDNYDFNVAKLRIVPFGANLDHNNDLEDIKNMVRSRSKQECSLLFSGVDWDRKGGNFAIEVARKLNELGICTKLHLVGIKDIPGNSYLPDYVINHGFMSKSTFEGKMQIEKLFASCHFFILPTIADATPLVLSEANSFGLPCLTNNVGGISTIIKDNINGKCFHLNQKTEDYVNYIHSVFTDQERYKEFAFTSFNEYTTRLNWKVAGATIMKIFNELK